MKKKIIRSSMIVVAAMSIMLGGTSYTTSVKEEISETPAIISKAIENSVAESKEVVKGVALTTAEAVDVAEAPVEQTTEVQEQELEEKEAKLESNQVVANIDSFLNIRTEPSEEAEVVGKFYRGNVGTVVEKGDEWSVVASGNAYGYVHNDYLLFGEAAEAYIENNCDQVAKVATETLNVRADKSTESDILTLTDEGSTFTILGNDNGWVTVALDEEQVGYVSSDYVYIDYVYETAVTIEEEQAAIAAAEAEAAAAQAAAEAEAAAQQQQQQEQQQPTTQAPATTQEATTQAATTEAPKKEAVTNTDVQVSDEDTSKETVQEQSGSSTGQAIANYAVQFVGNPYVYGGTSLTNGADCSGFVQSVYKHFGYSLPRTAASQAGAGRQVSVDNLQPGDLLFYHGYGHVAIYIGGGQVVHASNKKTGIKISSYNYSPINKAVRIVK